jgi:hypothetical protein
MVSWGDIWTRVPQKASEFLDKLGNYQLSKKTMQFLGTYDHHSGNTVNPSCLQMSSFIGGF